MKNFVFIESNTTGTGRLFIGAAREQGMNVVFLCREPDRYPFLVDELVQPCIANTGDRNEILALIRQMDPVGVMSSSEYFLELAADVAASLGLPTATPAAIARCRDKHALYLVLGSAGVSVPDSCLLSAAVDGVPPAPTSIGWPMVVKPVEGSGSLGVRLIENQEAYEEHVALLLSQTTTDRGQNIAPRALAQRFVSGPEFSVEIVGDGEQLHVLGVTRKHLGHPPHFVEVGHDFPADLEAVTRDRLVDEVCSGLRAVGLTFGPSHTEVRIERDRPFIIEVNPRLAGGMIPSLIQEATGINVLDAMVRLYQGGHPSWRATRSRTASIAFVIPSKSGVVSAVSNKASGPGVVEHYVSTRPGTVVRRTGDFRERVGHVIAVGTSATESRSNVDAALGRIELVVEEGGQGAAAAGSTGRLRQTLQDEALAIVRKPGTAAERWSEFELLAAVDEAHLVMLHDTGLVTPSVARAILGEIRRISEGGFATLVGEIGPRGSYLLYEDALIAALGIDVAGRAHTGRSRNDINATLFRLQAREWYQRLARALWRLRYTLLQRVRASLRVAMPVYSQFQPGQPGTLAYWLLAAEEALTRDSEWLESILPSLDQCPLGAGAGAGTTFAIDPSLTANLLGFTGSCRNALDAVASRDLALRLLSVAATAGTTVSRLATDLQIWTTQEFGFFDLPDGLAGGSSMMPQKKNPYLLEMLKGRAVSVSGTLTSALAITHKTPFSNSVEVGTEAMKGLAGAIADLADAMILLALHIEGLSPRPEAMARSASRGVVIAASVTENLVREHGLPFREAHHRVGRAITEALEASEDAEAAVLAMLPSSSAGRALIEWADALVHGGGPGEATRETRIAYVEGRLRHDGHRVAAKVSAWNAAADRRGLRVSEVIGQAT